MSSAVPDTKRQSWASAHMAMAVCAIAAIALAFVMVLSSSEEAYAYGFKTETTTTNSITLTWDDPSVNYSSYNTVAFAIAWVPTTDANDQSKIKTVTLDAAARSYTITGLKAGTRYAVELAYAYLVGTSSNVYTGTVARDYALGTRVVTPTGVKQTKWTYKDNKAYFSWNVQNAADKVEVRLLNVATGKSVLKRSFSSMVETFYAYGLKTNIAYAVQMRAHDSKGWTAWSSKTYFLSQPLTTSKTKVANNKLTVAWNKVKGAQKYSIYVSTKLKSGYKKVATVKSTKSKVTLKKFKGAKFNKNKKYYVYVQATKKIGSKTYTSGKRYAYMVKGSKGSMKYPF